MARRDPPDDTSVTILEPIEVDWRIPLIAYLKQPDPTADRKIRFLALNYFLRGDELRRRSEDGIDFRCVYGHEAKQLMHEVHSGICGAHQAGPKMRWLLRRHGYFWPSILKDCIAFAKGCLDCQAHGPVQHHKFIIVTTNFFTKWVEAEPLKEASGGTLRQFLFRNIICRFGIPEVFVSDRGVAFMGGEVDKLAKEWGIQFVHSSPYYAQSNGQAEASNKIIITLLKKMLEVNPRQWHETLWAYRTSKRNPTATTPYALMFGHDAVLPLEVNVQSLRVQEQHHLIREDYVQAMWQEHEDLSEKRLEALDSLVMEKQRVARAYDKRTRGRSYSKGELVWKAVLPLGEKLDGRGKWTPRWEGPYIIYKILEK
ncbi:protein NYNRIN-like [Rosa chinensis]|uniref:protein NYNRIN-like n=1 Tax=Rosa chinensis TaxID=74649 RepID=UPI000D08D2E4|nr:protein NYNRIN-like [Rosa chinensis]